MPVTDAWPPKRPGPASDGDNVARQTLRAGIRAPPPEKPYASNVIGGTGKSAQQHGMVWYGMVWYGMVWYGMVWYGMVRYGMVEV